MGLTTEEQPAAFAKALSLGVSTLELDTQVSADGKVIVSHDRAVDARKCRDTAGNTFVGTPIKDLTLDQIRSLDCGFVRYPGFDEQEVVTGGALAELKDVVAVWRAHDAKDVWFDIEIKFDPSKPAESVGREEFVRTVVDEINALGIADRTMVQAFDWLTLVEVNRLEPQWPLVALTSTDDYPPSLAAGVPGVEVYAPKETIVTKAMVARAHESGLRVIPWTVDDPSRMEGHGRPRRRRADHQLPRPGAHGPRQGRGHPPATAAGALSALSPARHRLAPCPRDTRCTGSPRPWTPPSSALAHR